jgi:hypothetical protein
LYNVQRGTNRLLLGLSNLGAFFDAIVQSAARLCGAIFSAVYLYEDDHVHIAATNNFSPEAARRAVELREQKRPDRSHLGGRAILDRAIVHVPDVAWSAKLFNS